MVINIGIQKISLKLLPSEAADDGIIKEYVAAATQQQPASISGYHILKRSIDARGRSVFINLQLNVFINEPYIERPAITFRFRDVTRAAKKSADHWRGTGGALCCP